MLAAYLVLAGVGSHVRLHECDEVTLTSHATLCGCDNMRFWLRRTRCRSSDIAPVGDEPVANQSLAHPIFSCAQMPFTHRSRSVNCAEPR